VAVIERTDFNYFDVADAITASILSLVKKDKKEVEEIRKRCFKLAKQAEWSKFIVFYQKAFSDALEAATKRNS